MSLVIAIDIAISERRPDVKTVQMTLDEDLVAAVDKAAKRLGTSRSALTREALRAALDNIRVRELERRQRAGYARKPVRKGEFSIWEQEQRWGDR
jgi:predicted transcriptional regulator